jgi:hypothetical protein
MATRKPVVSLDGLHDELGAGDVIAGNAVQRSADSGNTLALGSDGGLKVTQSSVAAATNTEVIAGTVSDKYVSPSSLRNALGTGQDYRLNVGIKPSAGSGGTTATLTATNQGGGGLTALNIVGASAAPGSGVVDLLNLSVWAPTNDANFTGIRLDIDSLASSFVRGITANVRGKTTAQGISFTLSTEAVSSQNLLRYSTADDGIYLKGKIVATGTITPSDARLKRNIHPLSSALDFINALRVVTCEKTTPEEVGQPEARYVPSVDVLAQELQRIGPEHVETLSNGYLGVNDRGVFYRLVRAVQELSAQVTKLESQR